MQGIGKGISKTGLIGVKIMTSIQTGIIEIQTEVNMEAEKISVRREALINTTIKGIKMKIDSNRTEDEGGEEGEGIMEEDITTIMIIIIEITAVEMDTSATPKKMANIIKMIKIGVNDNIFLQIKTSFIITIANLMMSVKYNKKTLKNNKEKHKQ